MNIENIINNRDLINNFLYVRISTYRNRIGDFMRYNIVDNNIINDIMILIDNTDSLIINYDNALYDNIMNTINHLANNNIISHYMEEFMNISSIVLSMLFK